MQANDTNDGKSAYVRWLAVAASAGAALILAVEGLRQGFGRLGVALDAPVTEPAFVAVAQIIAASGGGWLAVSTLCVVFEKPPWSGRRAPRRVVTRCVPRCWRAAVLAAVGTGLLAGPAFASAAATAVHAPADHRSHSPRGGALAMLEGLSLPDRASGRRHGRSTVVVARGDCLWSLAAATLPGTATNSSVARHTERWYRANADVIGADPNLLLPGTRLRAPGAAP